MRRLMSLYSLGEWLRHVKKHEGNLNVYFLSNGCFASRLICHVQEIFIFNDFKETRKLWVEIDGDD